MRKLATVCLAFSAGIFFAQYVLPQQWLFPLAAAFGVLSGAAWFVLREKKRLRAVLILLSLAFALSYNAVYTELVRSPNEALCGTVDTLTIELCDYADETEHGTKAEVRILERGLRGKAVYYGTQELLAHEPGTRLKVPVFVNSSAKVYDNEITTFTSKGVYLLLYNRGAEDYLCEAGSAWRFAAQRMAKHTQEVIAQIFPARTEPFIRSLLLGDKSDLSVEELSYLDEAGLYHITAVSGLHCAFLLSLLTFLVGAHRRKLLSAIAIPLLCFYALMVGVRPSVVRSCVMLIMVLLAPLFEREDDALTSLSLALMLILLANPFAAASIGLQLSFAAMAGILWLTPKLCAVISTDRRRIGKSILTSFAVTAGASVFTVPLCAYYFGILSLIAPLSNLLCLWAASATFMASFVCTVLGFIFAPLARILAFIPHIGARYILTAAKLLCRIPYHAIFFANSFLKYWLVYVYALFGACYFAKKGRVRYAAASVLSVLTLALTILLNALPYSGGSLHVVALDVGQGQCVVLHSRGETAMVDCGSSNSYISAGSVASAYLQSIGQEHLDYLVLSHYHADHINGVRQLLTQIDVDTMVLPNVEDETTQKDKILQLCTQHHINVLYASQVEELTLGDADLTVYPPLGKGSTNEEGLTVLCTAGTFDVLLTGDMDRDTEEILIGRYDLPDIEMLMVGHHGSKKSTGTELLKAVTPEIAVISVGDNNYGHPTDAALYRLTDEEISVYRTDLQGNIHITVN